MMAGHGVDRLVACWVGEKVPSVAAPMAYCEVV